MIIDFHTHVFPDKIVERAMKELSESSGAVAPHYDGTVPGLIKYMDEKAIDRCVALNIATNERQQTAVNNFAASIDGAFGGRIISFGSVYPAGGSAVEELYRIKSLGLKGIKLHPDYQNFFVDESCVVRVYETAAKLGLITVFHAGLDLGLYDPIHAGPERLASILPAFSGAPVVAAHFGGYMSWDGVEKHLVGKDVYFDTSYCYSRMPYMQAKKIIKAHGADKILFGSDLPWSGSDDEARFAAAVADDEIERELIMHGNAERLLGEGRADG